MFELHILDWIELYTLCLNYSYVSEIILNFDEILSMLRDIYIMSLWSIHSRVSGLTVLQHTFLKWKI